MSLLRLRQLQATIIVKSTELIDLANKEHCADEFNNRIDELRELKRIVDDMESRYGQRNQSVG